MADWRRRKRPKLRRRRKRDRAEDVLDCGCCIGDLFAGWTLAAGAFVVWRQRR